MPVVATVIMMVVIVLIPQQPGAEQIDAKPERRDRDCLIEGNWYWMEQTYHTFIGDQQCDHCQHDCAREPSQIAKLAGSDVKRRLLAPRRAKAYAIAAISSAAACVDM